MIDGTLANLPKPSVRDAKLKVTVNVFGVI